MTSKYTILWDIWDEANEFKIQIADGCEEIEYGKTVCNSITKYSTFNIWSNHGPNMISPNQMRLPFNNNNILTVLFTVHLHICSMNIWI